MTFMIRFFILLVLILAFALNIVTSAFASGHLSETRYCWPIVRDANGVIVRSTAVYREFRKLYPCPTTGLTYGPCAGWAANHTVPLICNGCDSVVNLSWVPVILKAGPGSLPIDRWEQKVYCKDQRVLVPMPDAGKFRLEVVPR